ncbi:hypothetical protein XENOCAPTIV_002170 [Xenoophorus captivus]|uniref:Uncharacterized protein n=1 Tax=Xenoophorus captivus TaxID=1517983 RepID=A0ABV0RPQ9_9TELE
MALLSSLAVSVTNNFCMLHADTNINTHKCRAQTVVVIVRGTPQNFCSAFWFNFHHSSPFSSDYVTFVSLSLCSNVLLLIIGCLEFLLSCYFILSYLTFDLSLVEPHARVSEAL